VLVRLHCFVYGASFTGFNSINDFGEILVIIYRAWEELRHSSN
jgi:hypothetical protein